MKILLNLIIIGALTFLTSYRPAYAACQIADPEALTNPAEQLLGIVCPIAAGINLLVVSAGAVFVMMMFYGSIKLSLSQGDAKGIENAKQLLTWAVIGFFCVIGVYGILAIVLGIFGVNGITSIRDAIASILAWIRNP